MITSADENLILGFHDAKLSAIANIGRVIPAPLYFADKREFWASGDQTDDLDTQAELETNLVKFASVSFARFSDDPETPLHSPLITLNYELYLFSEYDVEREDETADVDLLTRRRLKRHKEFIQVILDIKAAYQVEANIGVLDTARYARSFTQAITQDIPIQTKARCKYIEDVVGMEAQFNIPVLLKLKEC